jgi:hypothetical protein
LDENGDEEKVLRYDNGSREGKAFDLQGAIPISNVETEIFNLELQVDPPTVNQVETKNDLPIPDTTILTVNSNPAHICLQKWFK